MSAADLCASGLLKLLLTRSLYLCMRMCLHACVCVPAPEAIDNLWHDMYPVYKFYTFYVIAVVDIVSSNGLRIEVCHRNQHNMTKLLLYNVLFSLQQLLKTLVHK